MKTTNIGEIEQVIAAQDLVEISQVIFAKINAIPRPLEKGEQMLARETILYASKMTPQDRGTVHLTEPNPKEPALYDGDTRERFFTIKREFEEKLNENYQTTLSPLNIYCQKTGQPIGQLNTETLITALQIHGREKLSDLLFNANCNAVHPAWVQTASNETQFNELLDKLCEMQPHSYAVYVLNMLTAHFHRPPHIDRARQREAHAAFHWSIARAYQILSLLPREELPEVCDALCHMATYAPKTMQYFQRRIGSRAIMPEEFAKMAIGHRLLPEIEKAIDFAINKKISENEAERRPLWMTNLGMIEDAARGPSQIRRQRISIKKHLADKLKAKLAKKEKKLSALVAELGASELFQKKEMPGQEGWRKHLQQKPNAPQSPENVIFAEEELPIEFLNALQMGGIENPHDAGDDTVEMRTISWAELQNRAVEDQKIRDIELAAKPTLSLRDRLAKIQENRPEEIPSAQIEKPKTGFLSRLKK